VLGCVLAAFVSAHRAASSTAPSEAPPPRASAAQSASLELGPRQLEGLRLERVGAHSFPVEKQAVGSISFDEDPSIVQAESTLLTASANLGLSNKELKRVQGLGEGNGIPQKELEHVRGLARAAHHHNGRDCIVLLVVTPDSEAWHVAHRDVRHVLDPFLVTLTADRRRPSHLR
jgi:hypothetical protein